MSNPYEKYATPDNPYSKYASKEDVRAEQNRMLKEVMGSKAWGTGVGPAIDELGGKITDLTGSPAAGYVSNILLNAIPSFLTMTKGLPGPSGEQVAHNALVGQRSKVLEEGKRLGLKVPPTQAQPNIVNRTLESLGGKAAVQQQASDLNQNVVYQIAQKESGVLPSEPITKETLKAARARLAQPYREIEALEPTGVLSHAPFKSPTQTLKEISELRQVAKDKWKFYGQFPKPSIKEAALQASGKADELEVTLEAYARQANRPDLVDKIREARVALAKNYTVERAMRGSSFDPSALSRLESRGRTPLTGDLETVMQMYRDFPKAMAAPQIAGSPGVNQLLPWLGAGGGGYLGGMLGGAAGLAASQAIPPVARSLILSNPYQALMTNYKPITNPALMQGVVGNPALMIPLEEWATKK